MSEHDTGEVTWPFDPDRERYVSLATLRRDGREVRTPVWVVAHGRQVGIFTAGRSGKVKRLRRTPEVRIAACTARGTLTGTWCEAFARRVDAEPERQIIMERLRAKYAWQMTLVNLLARIGGRIHEQVVYAFELSARSPPAVSRRG